MVLCGLVVWSQEYPPDWAVVIGIGATIGLVASPIYFLIGRYNRFTVLTVESGLLSATGRGVGKLPWSKGSVRIPFAQIDWLGFIGGNATDHPEWLDAFGGSMSGIYVCQGATQSTCLLRGISRTEAESVLGAIAQRFPALCQKISKVRPENQPANVVYRNAPDLPSGQTPVGASVPSAAPPSVISPMVSDSQPTRGEIFGKVNLTIEENPEELRFRADRETGRIARNLVPALPGILLLVCAYPFYSFSAYVFPILLVPAVAIYWFMHKWIKPFESTTLSVNAQRFQATGDRVKENWTGFYLGAGKIVLPVEQITSFLYMNPDDDPGGIWVNSGWWKSKCMLPGIDRQQGIAVIMAIVRKFPELAGKGRCQ